MNDVARHNAIAPISTYDAAIAALAEARAVDDVMHVRDEAERMRIYARRAKNRDLIADAMEIQLRAERALGAMLIAAKAAGQIGRGAGFHAKADAQKFPHGTFRVRLAEAGIDRKLSMRAQQIAAAPDEQFSDVVTRAREKIVAGGAVVVNPLKDLTGAEKQKRRDIREWVKAQEIIALPKQRFGIIYADPEWKFLTRSPAGMDRSADNHYRTSGLAALQARPVAEVAAPDCILFLWATVPMLVEAICVAEAWGFMLLGRDEKTGFLAPDKSAQRYVSGWTWLKEKMATGYWVRNQHELLLIFTRGNPVPPAMGTQTASVAEGFGELGGAYQERATTHSRKPDAFADEIMRLWPNTPKLEMNARGPRDGWTVWGDEAGTAAADVYAALVAADALKGQHTQRTAEPILRAAYACDPIVPTKQVAADLGAPVGSVLGWASRLRLTKSERRGGPDHIGQKVAAE